MYYFGDIKAGRTLDFAFDTQADALPSSLSAATVKVYKGSSTTTETTTGVTHTEDFDALTGLNHVTIDTSADGAFYAAGNDFAVVLTTGTLNGQTIRRVLGHFSIENRAVNWAQVVSPTTTVGLTGTTISTSQVVASVTAGVTLAASAVQAIWDALTSALTTVGSIGKLLVTDLDAAVSTRSTVTTTDIRTQATAALVTDTYAEPSSVPAATASLKDKIGWLCTVARNKITQTATTQKVRNDGDSSDVASSTVSDDGTTFTRGKYS